MSFWVNINTQSREVPNHINGTFNPQSNIDVMVGAGWRIANEPDAPADGYERTTPVEFIQDPAKSSWATPVYHDTLVQARLDAEAAEAYAATLEDLSSNAARYTYQNCFLLICDNVMNRSTHEKLAMEDLTAAVLAIKATDEDRYNTTRDALFMIDAKLTKLSIGWHASCVWKDADPIVTAAQSLYNLIM